MNDSEDLLQPSLGQGDDAVDFDRPFSPNSLVFATFFGGPLAGAVLFAWNDRKLGEPERVPLTVLVFLAAFVGLLAYPLLAIDDYLNLDAAVREDVTRDFKLTSRAITIVLALIFARMQTRRFDIFRLNGGEPSKALVPAIITIAVTAAIGYGLVLVIVLLSGAS